MSQRFLRNILRRHKRKIARLGVALLMAAFAYFSGLVDQSGTDRDQQSADSDPFLKVARVADGDTVVLSDDSRIRLFGIDAPELNQPFGSESRGTLTKLVGSRVQVETIDIDQYERTVAVLWNAAGDNVNAAMICAGAAWWYERHAQDELAFRNCERAARQDRLGLWAARDPIAPWDWRRRQ